MELAKKSDAKILAVVNPIMDNLMQGSSEINHKKHTKDFTDRIKAIVNKEYLEKVCRSYPSELGIFQQERIYCCFPAPIVSRAVI